MSEEEIPLSGNLPRPSSPISGPSNAHDHTSMQANIANLTDLNAGGKSPEEFLRELLSKPTDQLIPWEECTLPSRGVYYGWQDGTLYVRAMGQAAEKALASQRLAQSGQNIDYLFRECVRYPDGFQPEDMLIGDRVFLLYYIRGITHGNLYEFAITCPNQECQKISTQTYDLNELSSTIQWADPDLGTEPFRVNLPYLSQATGREVYVGVRFLRGTDANDILNKRKTRKKMFARPGGVRTRGRNPFENRQQEPMSVDDSLTENLEKLIVHVMGVSDPIMIRQFIGKMHAQDTATIRQWLKDNTPGIDTTIAITCPDCAHEFTVELPITESFFRPSKSARTG
jgi:hypothetical protein